MKITLIFPPYNHKIFEENLSTVDEDFGVLPPLNVLYVAAILEAKGHKVQFIDAHALKLTMQQTEKLVQAFKPDIFGFMLTTYMFHQTLDWIQYFKNAFKKTVLVGGINLDHYAKETLSYPDIDFGIIGDALHTLPNFLHAFENNQSFENVSGIMYKKKGKLYKNEPEIHRINLEQFPFPARHLAPNDKYYSFISQKKNFTIMLSSRGCPFECVFCVMANTGYQVRNPKNVVDEMELCYREQGIKEIDFFDPVLPLDRQRMFDMSAEIIKRKLPIVWSCRSRIEGMDDALIKSMGESGCRAILYGIESGDQTIADNMKKKIDLDKTYHVLDHTQKCGIKTLGFFITGGVGDTKETIKKTIKFAKTLPLDFAQFSRMVPKPMTSIDKQLIQKTKYDYWREYVKGNAKEQWICGDWTELSQAEIEKLTKRAYWSFYFRPKIILRRIFGLQSWGEFWRYVKTGMKMIFTYEYKWEDKRINK